MDSKTNIILIGMPGVGKSTVGVLLAKALGRYFLDTDVFIQALEDRPLQQIIDDIGLEKFCLLEEQHILCIDIKNAVIATGGSAVYSPRAMQHLSSIGQLIHLDLPFDMIRRRIDNLYTRGVVMAKGQSLRCLYDQRQGLYQKYAQLTVDCTGKTHEQIVSEISRSI